jgi:hypothetical protein
MRVKVCARSRVDETGTPPDDRACEALPSTEWELVLKPVPSAPLKLEGTHQYSVAGQTYSRALKYYTYVDV